MPTVAAAGTCNKSLTGCWTKIWRGVYSSLTVQAADAAGTIAAKRQQAERTVEIRDVQIAGITSARKATLATRNIRHFEGLGIHLVDPWRQ